MQNLQYFYVILSVINLARKSKNVLMKMLVDLAGEGGLLSV